MTKRTIPLAGAALVIGATVFSAACGGSSSAKIVPSSAAGASASAAASNGTPGARGGFGNRTPRADFQTAIAEGTPASALRGQGGGPGGAGGIGGGGRRTVATVATLLGVDPAALQTELQATGATIASVAAAHGKDRATVRQALVDAQRQRIADAVANGSVVQADADAMAAQFETRVDALLDGNGAGPGGNPGDGGAPPPAP